MEIIFSNHEILWKESSFPLAQLLLSLGILFYSLLVYLFYKVKFKLSSLGSLLSIAITVFVLQEGGGCNSDLKLNINTFTGNNFIEDNLSKAQYKFSQEKISGLMKLEYNKTEQKKTVTYHELLLVLQNNAYLQLIKTTKAEEIKSTLGKIKKEINLPLYFNWNEIPKPEKQNKILNSRELCEAKFEKIESEIFEDHCRLTWSNKLQGFLYPIFCVILLFILIWIDSIFIEGFTKSHFYWLIGICIFAIPFGYLTLQKWNAKTVVLLHRDKINSYTENFIFGKQNENTILYSEINSLDAKIETTVDSFVISSYTSSETFPIQDSSLKSIASKYLYISIFGLPVVDKLILCDTISKFRNTKN